jgi:3-oxoadipate enol-lactonase
MTPSSDSTTLATGAPRFVDRGTHRIRYDVLGDESAPPVLLVMGMAFASSAWDTLPAALAERFRVITYDNRGTGASPLPRGFFRMSDLADDAAAVLDAAGVARAHVFGISMGGMASMELALRHRARVQSLVLGATFAGYRKSVKPSLRVMKAVFASALFAKNAAEHVAPVLVSKETYASESERERFAVWLSKVGRAAPRTVLRQMIAVSRHACEARLAQLDVRTMVITGTADALVPARNSSMLAKLIPGAQLVEIAGAGHCFPFERLDETKRAVTRFFLDDARAGGASVAA